MASSTTVTPFTPAYFEVTPAAASSSTITPFTRASFEDTPVTDVFNLANFQNLDVLTSTDPEEMEMFIDVHFDGKRFISFDLEYQGSFDFIRNVDGQDLRLTTMDIVSLQFAVDGRALVVPIHGNKIPQPIRDLLTNVAYWKYGVGIAGDVVMLQKFCNLNTKSCVELSSIAKAIDRTGWEGLDKTGLFHSPVSLDTLASVYLKLRVVKPDWEKLKHEKLTVFDAGTYPSGFVWKDPHDGGWLPSQAQIDYMATDVIVADQIFRKHLMSRLSYLSQTYQLLLFDAAQERIYAHPGPLSICVSSVGRQSTTVFEGMQEFDLPDSDATNVSNLAIPDDEAFELYPFHVGIAAERSVDGKREYDLYYNKQLVRARLCFLSSGTQYRWRSSDMKWYMCP